MTDAEVVRLMSDRLGIYGEIPLTLRLVLAKDDMDKTVIAESPQEFLHDGRNTQEK